MHCPGDTARHRFRTLAGRSPGRNRRAGSDETALQDVVAAEPSTVHLMIASHWPDRKRTCPRVESRVQRAAAWTLP
jgi:hypothetical protein